MRVALLSVPRSEDKITVRGKQAGFLPPIGLATIAAILQKAGHEVFLFDAWGKGSGITDILAHLRSFLPQVIGLSFSTPQLRLATALSESIKQEFNSGTIIVGGPHVTSRPGEMITSTQAIDAEIIGEADLILPQIINSLARKENLEGLPNTIVRTVRTDVKGSDEENGIIRGPTTKVNFNIDALPFPARHLLDLDLYGPEPHESRSPLSTSIIATRGCSYSACTFCLRSGPFRRIYRAQSAKRTIAEMELLHKQYGTTEFQFHDDDLFSHQEWIESFTKNLLEKKMPFSWFARGRPSAIRRDTFERAREAGLYGLEIGFESGNQETLDLIKKGITLDESRKVTKWAKELGVMVIGNFILGFPNESPGMGEKTIKFAKEIDPDYAIFIPLHPEPGTEVHELASLSGSFIRKPYEKSHKSRFIPSVSYVPEHYENPEQLGRQIRRAFSSFYLRPKKLAGYISAIRRPYDIKRYLDGLGYFAKVLS